MVQSCSISLENEQQTLSIGACLAKHCLPGTVIYLKGDLGAGKTTLSRGFLRGLGYEGIVKSPTFTIIEPYLIAEREIFHFDLYRLGDPQELLSLGLEDYFTENSICLIEWPEKGEPELPAAHIICNLLNQEQHRKIIIQGITAKGQKILDAVKAGIPANKDPTLST